MLDVFKTLTSGILEKAKTFKGDWNENNSSSPNYIKNRPFYTGDIVETILVDNLTSEDYNNGEFPACNFIPGNVYKVIWNGEVYDNLTCFFDGEYNIIATPDDGYPFYIDDDGVGSLYIETDNEDETFTVSITTSIEGEVYQIDTKYLPDSIKAQPDWNQNDETASNYIKNRPFYEEVKRFVLNDKQSLVFKDNGNSGLFWGLIANDYSNQDIHPSIGDKFEVIFDKKTYYGTTYQDADACYRYDFTTDDGYEISICDSLSITSIPKMEGEHTVELILVKNIIYKLNKDFVDVDWDSYAPRVNPEFSGSLIFQGKNGVELGDGCSAIGDYSCAIGQRASAEGDYSCAIGFQTRANGKKSFAIGSQTYANNVCSYAEGINTYASGHCQHVQGKWNIEDTESVYAHIVGNGTFNDKRSNAHTLDWDGNAWYQGDIFVGGTGQDDANAKKIATEEYVDSNKPTKTSELTNDSGFITSIPDEYITETELTAKNYIDNTTLEGKGYLTEHQDLSSYALKTELHSHDNKTVLDTITDTKITEWDSKSTFSGSYNDLTDKPTIPSIEGLATEQYVNNMISFNDAGELVVTINGVSKTFVAKTE